MEQTGDRFFFTQFIVEPHRFLCLQHSTHATSNLYHRSVHRSLRRDKGHPRGGTSYGV